VAGGRWQGQRGVVCLKRNRNGNGKADWKRGSGIGKEEWRVGTGMGKEEWDGKRNEKGTEEP